MKKLLPITYKALLGHLLLLSVLVSGYFLLLDRVISGFLAAKVKKEIVAWVPELTSPDGLTAFKEIARNKAQQNEWHIQLFTEGEEFFFNSGIEHSQSDMVSLPVSFNDKEYELRVLFNADMTKVSSADLRKIYIYLGAFFSMLFVVLSFTMMIFFSKPIHALFRSINAFALGKQPKLPELDIQGNSEAAVFAKILNQLGDDMRISREKLYEEKQRKSIILEVLEEGIIIIDSDLGIKDVNIRASKILQLPKADIIGKTLRDLFSKTPMRILQKSLELSIASLHNHALMSDSVYMDDENTALFDIVVVPLGVDQGLAIILQDRSSNHRIVTMGREFIANASHELRTPITIIKGFAEMLQDLPEISESMLDDITEKIVRNCHRMTVLVKNLLVLADLDNLAQASLEEHDLLVLIDSCRHQLMALHPDVTIEVNVPRQAILMEVDGSLIELAIMNLLENAVKYSSPPASIIVKVIDSDEKIIVEVTDQGIGIPQNELENIFDRFYTVNKAHARKLGGAGLGLSIVHNIVEKHGGQLQARSSIGSGTTFSLVLPKARLSANV